MMTEQMAYTIIGIIGYFVAYVLVGFITTDMWKLWARKQVGEFWEYALQEGYRAYHPKTWYYVRYHNFLYSVLYIGLWPVMLPWQTVTNTKVIRRVMSRGYYF